METLIAKLIIAAVPVILGITLHEAAHAYVARLFGDPTAEKAGRITLNPLAHIDPLGTLLIPALLLFVSQGAYAFGYAKPVPVNYARLRHPTRDMLWVAAAGPLANLVMAAGWLFLHGLLPAPPESIFAHIFMLMCVSGILVNLSLFTLNILPLPPLDGGRIVTSLLPMRWAVPYARIEPYGILILLVLLFSGLLNFILEPLIKQLWVLLQILF
ncbi:MAG: site-2 protease family protein [Zoogloeaceae bacterium]|jgi:Zn-dependent protease|nr:site-2 protease family protein [Zoogloeaceae bacterium]